MNILELPYGFSRVTMRTTIVIDDTLLEHARQLTGIQNVSELVHVALKILIQIRKQEEVRRLRGKLHWRGNLDKQRADE